MWIAKLNESSQVGAPKQNAMKLALSLVLCAFAGWGSTRSVFGHGRVSRPPGQVVIHQAR